MSSPDTPAPAPRVLSEEVKHANKVFSVVHRRLAFPDGQEIEREIIRHPGAAAVLAFVDPENVVMVRQYRDPVGETILEVPAGVIESGEPAFVAAHRELQEETGYSAAKMEPVLTYYPTPGILGEQMHLFVAFDVTPGDASPEADERLKPVTMPFADLQEMVRTGKILDGKTVTLVTMMSAFPPESLTTWRNG